MEALKYIWKYLKKHAFMYGFATLLVFVASTIVMISPYLQGRIIDEIVEPHNLDLQLLLKLLGGILLVVVIKNVLRYIYIMMFEYTSQDVLMGVRCDLYKRLQSLDFNYFDHNRTGDILTKMTGDVDMVRHMVAWGFFITLEQIVTFVTGLIVLFSINWQLALVEVLLAPFLFYFTNGLAGHVRPSFVTVRKHFARLNSVVQENISGNRVVKAFAKEDYEIEKFTAVNTDYYESNIAASRVWQKYFPPLSILSGMFQVVLIIVGGYMVINGSMSIGQLVTANGLIWTLSNPIERAGWLINDWQRFFTSAEKILELAQEQPKIQDNEKKIKKEHFNGKVEFRHVNFAYENQPTLMDINFTVYPGQTVAIIGATGSGKSTLMNLICRFYDVAGGAVLLDDIDVRDIAVQSLRRSISMAQQDIFLFSDTIANNIAYGVPDASREDIERVAKIADAHEFILQTPDGYETIVGERGVGLSGGQKQRIALARALIRNPAILILDDTTSSVDMETEHEIHRTLRQHYTDKTTFIIAHRISSVKSANLILVMDNGRIIEQGTHDELVALGGKYTSVFNDQLGDFNAVHEGGEA